MHCLPIGQEEYSLLKTFSSFQPVRRPGFDALPDFQAEDLIRLRQQKAEEAARQQARWRLERWDGLASCQTDECN